MTQQTRLWQLSEIIEELETAITLIQEDETLSDEQRETKLEQAFTQWLEAGNSFREKAEKTAPAELADFYPGYFDWIKDSFKSRPTFSLSDEAQALFDSQAEKLFLKGRHESTAASAAWYKKTPAHLLRLALPLHLHACYENPKSGSTSTRLGG